MVRMTRLPSKYSFVESSEIEVSEILALRKTVGWSDDDEARWEQVMTGSLYIVGVRKSNALVGIGFVAGNLRHAIFCDLCVHPAHQKKGIGYALLRKRLDWTTDHSVPFLYTSLSAQNPLRDMYKLAGFFIAVE